MRGSEAPRGTFQPRGREPCDKRARGPTPRGQERETHRHLLSHLRALVRVVEPADGAVEWHRGTDVVLCLLLVLHRSALGPSLRAFSICSAHTSSSMVYVCVVMFTNVSRNFVGSCLAIVNLPLSGVGSFVGV